MTPSIASSPTVPVTLTSGSTTAVRPLLGTEAGAHTHSWMEREASPSGSGRKAKPGRGAAGNARTRSRRRGTRADPGGRLRTALAPEIFAQLFAQGRIDPGSPETFDEAARAYRRRQEAPRADFVVDPPVHVDLDA